MKLKAATLFLGILAVCVLDASQANAFGHHRRNASGCGQSGYYGGRGYGSTYPGYGYGGYMGGYGNRGMWGGSSMYGGYGYGRMGSPRYY